MRLILLLLAMWQPALLVAQATETSVNLLLEKGDYYRAEKLLRGLIEKDPLPEYKKQLGEVYGLQMNWDEAIDIYRELSLMYPDNADFHFRYGGVLAKKAQSSNLFMALTLLGPIKSSFKKAISVNPGHIDAYWAIIDLYVSLPGIVGGSFSKAYEFALELKELSLLDGYLALGYIYEYDDEPENARVNYLRALDLLNNKSEIENNRLNYQIGKICAEYEVEMDRGIGHLTDYIANYTVLDGVPQKWAYYRLATIYRKKSDKSNALYWIGKSLEEDPKMKPALAEKSAIDRL